jgi:hypothetical protein
MDRGFLVVWKTDNGEELEYNYFVKTTYPSPKFLRDKEFIYLAKGKKVKPYIGKIDLDILKPLVETMPSYLDDKA